MIKESYKCSIDNLNKLDKSVPINLVLSGGGEKGVAHISLLEELEKRNIKINSISACSAGSLVGSMYASGVSAKEILTFF